MPFDLTFRTPITIPSDIPEKDQWGGGPHQGGHKGDWTQAEGNDFSAHVGTPVFAAFDCIIMGQGWFPDLIDKEARAGKVYGLQMIVKNDDGKDSPDTDRVRAFYTHINKLEKGIAPGAVLKRGDPIGKIRSSSGAGVHLHLAMVERVGATWAKPRGIEIPGDFRKWGA
jgi:murein DD-endopeptidase MepM/ murein hydrolase activator NlpD